MVIFSILICTIGRRSEQFANILKLLSPQVEKYKGKVEIVAFWNNGELPLAEFRQELVDQAKGKYIAFVDDDDEIPPYYVDEIMKAAAKDPDYIGWQMQAYTNGIKLKPTYHSMRYEGWSEDELGYYRDVSHLNPIKRSIALKVPFTHIGDNPEDYRWAQEVPPYIRTEEYIDKPMYFYRHNTEDSTWRGDFVKGFKGERPTINIPYFRYIEV